MNTESLPPRRGNWFLLTGILLGLGLGLVYAWILSPVKTASPAPASLRADFKDRYRLVIASAYQATGDLARAGSRLALLGDPDPVQVLTAQAQRELLAGNADTSALALAELAQAVQGAAGPNPTSPPGLALITLEPTGPSAAFTPGSLPASRPRPTLAPTFTPGAPFAMIEQEEVCNPDLPEGLLQVEVMDAAGQAVPGMELIISWGSSEDHFFTGLKPELGNGYADYRMTPEVTYTLQLADNNISVSGLTPPSCPPVSGRTFWGGIHLVFQQP